MYLCGSRIQEGEGRSEGEALPNFCPNPLNPPCLTSCPHYSGSGPVYLCTSSQIKDVGSPVPQSTYQTFAPLPKLPWFLLPSSFFFGLSSIQYICKCGHQLKYRLFSVCAQGAAAQVKERMEKVATGESLRPVLLFPEVNSAKVFTNFQICCCHVINHGEKIPLNGSAACNSRVELFLCGERSAGFWEPLNVYY